MRRCGSSSARTCSTRFLSASVRSQHEELDRISQIEMKYLVAAHAVHRREMLGREQVIDGGRDVPVAAVVVWQRAGRHAQFGAIGFAEVAALDGKRHKL